MNELIAEQIRGFDIADYLPIHERMLDLGDLLPPRRGNLVKVVVGMRCSGKSYRLFQEMLRVHESGVPWDRICYFNFEDDRLDPVTPAIGDEVLETFYSTCPSALEEGAYLFLDELQEMDGWGAWLRRVVDTTKATIYVSGSSSKMLSQEISTEFRGRAIDFELLPLSFREYVGAKEPGLSLGPAHSTLERLSLRRLFDAYLEEGGFPAALGLPTAQRVSLLQGYVQRVVVRDVVDRHALARPRVASVFARRVLGTNAKTLSVRRAEGDLRALGLPTSRALLATLLDYLEQAYLVFRVQEFSYALAEGTRKPPKVYAIDPGLALANGRANSNELGQRLEDAVYLELRRRNVGTRAESVSSFVTRGHGYEVDFVVGDVMFQDALELVQVSVGVEDETTRARELRALWEALEETGLEEATLVVAGGDEASYVQGNRRIRQVPAWKWFLEA